MNIDQFRKAADANAAVAAVWYEPVVKAMAEFGITTPKQKAMFLAHVGHESMSFACQSESLYYKDPVRIARIFKSGFDLNRNSKVDPEEVEFARGYVRNSVKLANRAYANRMGNGNEASGDGYKFRGRGPMQTTGRDNYAAAGEGLGLDLLSNPDLLAEPVHGARAAAFFWKSHGMNVYADRDQITASTAVINPAKLGLADRKARWLVAKTVLLA